MKFVAPLIEAERLTLLEARDQGPTAALRRRAQAVELSSRGYRLTAIAALLEVHRETVSGWLDFWATQGLRGLYMIEQDHRLIKRRVQPGLGLASLRTAWRTLRGYERMPMIRKGQVRGVARGDVLAQRRFMAQLFGIAA